jgi:hypothetical protein
MFGKIIFFEKISKLINMRAKSFTHYTQMVIRTTNEFRQLLENTLAI